MNEKREYDNTPKTEQRIRSVTDKNGHRWIVVETIISRWYAEAYFEKVLAGPQEEEGAEAPVPSSLPPSRAPGNLEVA